MAYRRNRCHVLWEYYPWLCRVWGILTAMSFWGIGAEAAYWGDLMSIYLLHLSNRGYIGNQNVVDYDICCHREHRYLLTAALLTFLETVFAFSICVVLCVGDEHEKFLHCWRAVLWLDDYKKGLFYMVLSIPCFVQLERYWLSVISGVMLCLCGVYYCIKTYKTKSDALARQLQGRRNCADVSVDIEDANDIINQQDIGMGTHMAIPQDSDSSSGGIAEQDEILEV